MEYRKDQPDSIQEMFNSIAKQYDLTNAVLSLQMHKLWNKKLIDLVTENLNSDIHLDLCAGTGEIGFSFLKKAKTLKKVYMLDFCEGMLTCAKEKSKTLQLNQHDISFVQADAQNIPLENESVQSATVAYGIRNIQDPAKSIREVYRVLKPNGIFGILELTEPNNIFLKFGHKCYLKTILPLFGKLLTSNKKAYEYLCNSIHNFTKPEKLELMLKEAGFEETLRKPLLGGVATIIYGKKPGRR